MHRNHKIALSVIVGAIVLFGAGVGVAVLADYPILRPTRSEDDCRRTGAIRLGCRPRRRC